jgi:predicted CoA-binding protein
VDLPELEKEYDRRTALEALRLVLGAGYRIVPLNPASCAPVANEEREETILDPRTGHGL